ncbi:MAG: metallopeptidase family protein [bacterium]
MDNSRFLALVKEAIENLPDEFSEALRNIRLDVEEWPDPDLLERLGYGRNGLLLGLYHGTPLTKRRKWSIPMMPDRIVIYKGPIEMVSGSDEEIKEKVRSTVLHEIGHFFGLDEKKMEDHGYG